MCALACTPERACLLSLIFSLICYFAAMKGPSLCCCPETHHLAILHQKRRIKPKNWAVLLDKKKIGKSSNSLLMQNIQKRKFSCRISQIGQSSCRISQIRQFSCRISKMRHFSCRISKMRQLMQNIPNETTLTQNIPNENSHAEYPKSDNSHARNPEKKKPAKSAWV